jgi:PAS domain S-box-containing protein
MTDSADHVILPEPDDLAPAGGSDVGHATSTAGRARLSRPVPSQLFAQRGSETADNGARVRPTRVIPALANQKPEEPHEPAPTPPPTEGAAPPLGVDYPPDLVFIVRADGTVLYVNRALGPRGEEDVIGSDFYDWVFPEQHAVVREALERVFNTGRADGVELSGIQGHEPDAWYECRIAPNHREGKVVSATIIARDVTRYKRSERALRTEHGDLQRLLEERTADLETARAQLAQRPADRDEALAAARRFRELLDAAGEAVFVTDPQTDTLVDANETACRWLRRRREDLLGQAVTGLELEFPVLPPASLDVQFTETRDTRRPLVLDGVHRRSDGSTFPVEVAVAAHSVAGREFVLAVVRDVKTRRRTTEALAESEGRYRALVAQSFDAVFLTTRSGQVVEANDAALALFGYERRDFVGIDARALMPKVEDVRRFQRAMADEGVVRRLEVELRHRDGSPFPAELSATRRPDAQDRLLGYQWVVRHAPGVRAVEPEGAGAQAATPESALVDTLPDPRNAAPGSGTRECILVVDADARALGQSRAALSRIGPTVLTASTAREAVQVVRSRTPHVTLAVVGPMPDGVPEDVARDLRAVFPPLRIILATPDDPFAVLERASDLAIEACLRHPVHPLALVQSVRDAMGELPGA